MPKKSANDDSYINNRLATFADQVIDDKGFEISSDDPSILRDLQKVVVEIHQSVSLEAPESQFTKRLQRRLIKVWQEEKQKNFFTRISEIFSPGEKEWRSTSHRQRKLAGQLALATMITLIIMVPLVQSTDILSGTSLGKNGLTILAFILVIGGSISAWYFWRRKN